MATAREKSKNAVAKLRAAMPSPAFHTWLRDLVGKEQNAPPLGQADGTLTLDLWMGMSKLRRTLEDLEKQVAWLEKKL